MGFSSVPRLPGWSFQQLIYGGVLPPPHCPDMSGPAVSPTDKLRKDSALRLGRARRGPPVTSEKSTLFIGVTKIVRFCKALRFSKRYRKYSGYKVHSSKFRVSYFALLIPACRIAGWFFEPVESLQVERIFDESTNGVPAFAGFVWSVRKHL